MVTCQSKLGTQYTPDRTDLAPVLDMRAWRNIQWKQRAHGKYQEKSYERLHGVGCGKRSVPLARRGSHRRTMEYGGPYNAGEIFKLDPTGKRTVLYAFTGGADGGNSRGRIGAGCCRQLLRRGVLRGLGLGRALQIGCHGSRVRALLRFPARRTADALVRHWLATRRRIFMAHPRIATDSGVLYKLDTTHRWADSRPGR